MMDKAADAFRTISEVAEDLDLPQHVLRFWETKFTQLKPLKRGGGRRYYRPDDVDLLRGIRYLLYGQGFTIKGVQRIIKDHGPKAVMSVWKGGDVPAPASSTHQAAGHAVENDDHILDETANISEELMVAVETFGEDELIEQRPLQMDSGKHSYQARSDVSIMRGGLASARGEKTGSGSSPILPLSAQNSGSMGRTGTPQSAAGRSLELTGNEVAELMRVLQDLSECRRILETAA